MKVFECIMEVENCKIVIDMPEELEGRTFKIEINELSALDEKLIKFHEIPVEERVGILRQFFGKDFYPDAAVGKYDSYSQ